MDLQMKREEFQVDGLSYNESRHLKNPGLKVGMEFVKPSELKNLANAAIL